MRCRFLIGLCTLSLSAFLAATIQAQQDPPNTPSAKPATTQENGRAVEGVVISRTSHTLVVRTDDNHYHLFTYNADAVPAKTVKPGSRVRVDAGASNDDGTQVAENIAVLRPGEQSRDTGTYETSNSADSADPAGSSDPAQTRRSQAAPPPPQVRHVTNEIENETRRWHGGGRIGFGFSPELFMFGAQSQIGPFFSSRLLFRPNAEFGFGELTDMLALNLEGAYRLRTRYRGGWTPYVGMGPSLNFIHQGASSGDVSFSNFSYKTGFNVFVGGQRRRTFVEMKTSLWSGQAPVLRLFVGYNF